MSRKHTVEGILTKTTIEENRIRKTIQAQHPKLHSEQTFSEFMTSKFVQHECNTNFLQQEQSNNEEQSRLQIGKPEGNQFLERAQVTRTVADVVGNVVVNH